MVIHSLLYLRDSRHIHRAQFPIVCNTRIGIEWGWLRTKGNRQALHQNSIRMKIIWGTWQGASDRRWQIEDIWGLCHTLCLPSWGRSRHQVFPEFGVRIELHIKLWQCEVSQDFVIILTHSKSELLEKTTKKGICKICPLYYFLSSCEDHLWEEGKLSSKSFCKYKITSEVCCDLSSCQSKETTAVCFLLWLIYSGA